MTQGPMDHHSRLRRFSLVVAVLGASLSTAVTVMNRFYWEPGNLAVLVANLAILAIFVALGAASAAPRGPRGLLARAAPPI
ncbi:MAG: hypothetical protein JRM75_01900 [Nitrososphaerota archaeon]|nr:hypothetical protein [Nitrososphaerota archaeon]